MNAAEGAQPSMTTGCPAASSDDPSPAVWSSWELRAALALFAVALIPRLLHLQQIHAHDPFFTIPAVDGQLYDAWAREIVAGSLQRDDVLILGPLYPHFMALTYAVFGPSLPVLKAVQSILGALSCVFVFALARELFDRRVALLAGAAAALYRMLIFYGGTVMVVNVQVPLVLLSLIAVVRALRRPSARAWLGGGLLLGLSALARQTVLLFVPVMLLWIGLSLREQLAGGRRMVLMAFFCAGVAIPILPFTIHNWVVAHDFVLINSTGGANLYMGNNARADGTWKPPAISRDRVDNPLAMRAAFTKFAEGETGRSLTPSQVSAFWSARASDWIKSAPGAWLRLEMRKLLFFFNAQEVWNNRSVTLSRDFSWVLRLPLLSFGVVAPLGLLGAALALRRWRELFPLYAMFAVYLASSLVFFVLSRYRMPSVPILMIFAAFAVVSLYDAIRARRAKLCVSGLVALVALAAFAHLDLGPESLYMAYFNLGNKYRKLEQWDRAVESYHSSLRINPGFIDTYHALALAYEGGGDREAAIGEWRKVLGWSLQRGDRRRQEIARRHLEALERQLPQPGDG